MLTTTIRGPPTRHLGRPTGPPIRANHTGRHTHLPLEALTA